MLNESFQPESHGWRNLTDPPSQARKDSVVDRGKEGELVCRLNLWRMVLETSVTGSI
jgi:hypothetical protein